MLRSERQRFFFREEPEQVNQLTAELADEYGGVPQEGISGLSLFRFEPDDGRGKRYLTVAVRVAGDSGPATGNITLRWRDEPEGAMETLAETIQDELNTTYSVNLMDRGELMAMDQSNQVD